MVLQESNTDLEAECDVDPAADEKAAPFARVQIAIGVACRIMHPSGCIVECGVLPRAF